VVDVSDDSDTSAVQGIGNYWHSGTSMVAWRPEIALGGVRAMKSTLYYATLWGGRAPHRSNGIAMPTR
jgi:hypothetical protein